MLELARLLVDPIFRDQSGVARGDGRPVVLLPGFLAGDETLAVMAAWLGRLGDAPYVCGFVANVDCSDRRSSASSAASTRSISVMAGASPSSATAAAGTSRARWERGRRSACRTRSRSVPICAG